jgi:signal transduction histidine kinase
VTTTAVTSPATSTVSRTPINGLYLTVATIVRCYMLGALAISFGHIITAAGLLGLTGWQAWTVPFAIDGFAVLGMIGRSCRFAASTQRTGLRLQACAGLLSLACNVYAGQTVGERLYGALIVSAFVVAEWYAGKLCPAPAPMPEPTVSDKRSAAARKAAATRKANTEAKAAAEADRRERRRLARQVAQLEKSYAGDPAPVSPAA